MKRRIVNDEQAVSPVIAVILMVAITVVLAAVLYVWASSFLGGTTKNAPTQLIVTTWSRRQNFKTHSTKTITQYSDMSKKNIEHRNASKMGKKYSHTGNKPLVESLTNKGVMVTQKVRKAQEAKRNA